MGGDRTANVMMHHRAGWKEAEIPKSSTTDVVAFDRSAEECISTCNESSLHVKPQNGREPN